MVSYKKTGELKKAVKAVLILIVVDNGLVLQLLTYID